MIQFLFNNKNHNYLFNNLQKNTLFYFVNIFVTLILTFFSFLGHRNLCGSNVCDVNAKCVYNMEIGGPACECKPGFRGDGMTCEVIGKPDCIYQ